LPRPNRLDVAFASGAAGSEKTEIVPRRRDVDVLAGGWKVKVKVKVLALACVLGLLAPVHAATAPTHGTGGITEEHLHVRRGDTLESVLAARGVARSEANPWIAAAGRVYDLRRLTPRRGLTLRFDRATRTLLAIRYEMDDRALLVLEKGANGIRAARASLPYFTEVKGAAGRIERGLREDATQAGVPPRIVSELADIFGWELDLDNDLRPGDEFRVLYENTWQAGGARPEPGNVLGAEIVARGRPTTAVFFEDADGHGAYYRPSGDPLSRDFLRYPVDFTEITSEFSLLRRHPMLHRSRPHLGVDLAAPVGTPVRAVASGTITEAAWVSELGRCVRVEHPGVLTSTYGHLARIAAGVRPGAAVERGQVIGYVGSSGLSTGPHLHFAMDRSGAYVNPLALTATAGARVPEAARRLFDRVQRTVRRELAALPRTANPLTVSLSTTAYHPE
jgi:murein DD-endopeptidase MepM/ murein hydrolase activator NlpD